MSQLTVVKYIDAPLNKVWESWDDFANIHLFNPLVSSSQLTDDSRVSKGAGCRRQCNMSDGKNWVREEIVEYIPQQLIKVKIYQGTMPLKEAVFTVRFEKNGGKTKVYMQMDFTPKFGFLGLLLSPMMKIMFKGMLVKLLNGNEKFVEQRLAA